MKAGSDFVRSLARLRFLSTLSLIACTVALACPLIGYGYLGTFTRYVADDFCAGRNLRIRGFWGSQIFTYQNHSGRFFSYFARIGVSLIGRDHETRFVPAILLVCWLAATTWALFQLTTLLKWRLRLLPCLLFAELIVFAMLRTGPDPGQSFYWQAGSFTYTVPIILITVFLGFVPHFVTAQENGRSAVPAVIFSGVLALCAAGCSETNAVFQCAGLAMAVAFCKWGPVPRAQRILPILYSGLAGSLLGSMVVVVAPGNAVREAGVRIYSAPLSKTALLLKTFAASARYMVDFLHTRPLAALGLFVVSLALINSQQSQGETRASWRSSIYVIIGGWIFAFFLIFSAILPGMYAFSSMPPDRALFVDHWILLLALMLSGLVFGWLASLWYAESWVLGLLAAACAVALILPWAARSARDNFALIRDLRNYAAEWDSEDAQLRRMKSNGELQISLPWNSSVASNGNVDQIGWISDDPTFFINTCTADYYGFKSLRTHRPDDGRDPQETTRQAVP
jgi:Family of unknown function (DUF6056)